MSLVDLNIIDFLNAVDSKTPTPGGGSVSALAIAQGISLLNMTAHLSIEKKKFLSSNQDSQKNYLDNFERLKDIKKMALNAVDEDTNAYNQVMNAYKLPKETDEQIKSRLDSIIKGTIYASKIPYDFCVLGLNCLKIAKAMLPLTSPSTTSDFGVGILMIYSGLKGGVLNIMTNMTGYCDNDEFGFISKASDIESEAEVIFQSLYNEVLKKLG